MMMSRSRRIYCTCYALMLLGLVVLHFLPLRWHPPTPQEQWNNFREWLGPAPEGLQAENWPTDAPSHSGIIFTFPAAAEKQAELIDRFSLAAKPRGTSPLPVHWQARLAPERPVLTAYRKTWMDAAMISGHDVWDMTMAPLNDGRILLAFRFRWDNEFGGRSIIMPAYAAAPERPMPLWPYLILGSQAIIFFLLAPLGFLLLFPGYNPRRGKHIALWFATALIFPIAALYLYMLTYSSTDALAAYIGLCLLLVPVQLIGAGILLLLLRLVIACRPPKGTAPRIGAS